MSLALGGDCLADIATLREHTTVFGKVPSDPDRVPVITHCPPTHPPFSPPSIPPEPRSAQRPGSTPGQQATDHDLTAKNPIVIDLDATLATAHSEKESAALTYKGGFGFHHRMAFVDQGQGCAGQPVAALLRPGNAGPTPPTITSR